MITKIDIEKFGLFENYNWDVEIDKQETFRRVNIIYGRNYSGKTTFSRVLKCIEDKKQHKNYLDAKFNIGFSNSKYISQANLDEDLPEYKIRVYNSDFVKENLGWLHNIDGTIKPFTILGITNVEIEKKIKEIEKILGSIEQEKGLLYRQQQMEQNYKSKITKNEYKQKKLDDKLRQKAKEIKENASIFNSVTYQINTIKRDIPCAKKQGELSAEIIAEKQRFLKEDSKDTLCIIKEAKPQFEAYYAQVDELLKRKIKPSAPITELINDSLLQEWVRQGIDRHKGKRVTCGFCGKTIDKSLWDKLDAHFSKESEELRKELKIRIDQLGQAKKNIYSFISLTKELFYSNFVSQFDAIHKRWNATIKTYSQSIDSLILELEEREKDIFKERELADIPNVSQTVLEIIQEFNGLIDKHNEKTKSLSKDQVNARIELKYSEVVKFLNTIDYDAKIKEIEYTNAELYVAKNSLNAINERIKTLNEEKKTLEEQAKDESRGAELVNRHLTHFFGHNELRLVAEGKAPYTLFKIKRESGYASNLSEGECSLISFCYFIAKMEDELKDEVNSSKLIIYIDDPISSLDSNHIFFMFSLIETIIAKPKKYCQLFISTHNLDFLKYLKQLTFPKYKPNINAKENKPDKNHFLIERKNKSKVILKLAPKYLKDYITEFNYLFSQIYNYSISNNSDVSHDYKYNFGNNMRKFLEAYLFYKYPSNTLSFSSRLKKFFDDDISYNLVYRITNEYSHLEDRFERGLNPIDVDEIQQISQKVIEKINTEDPEQYKALIESINSDN